MQPELELWLVRHGETYWNAAGRLAGWSDVPLSENGVHQASQLRPVLAGESFDRVWASDLVRAVETAKLAYGEPRTDERLRELFFGDLEGARWQEIDPALQDALLRFDAFESPGGETIETFGKRVLRFVSDLKSGRHLIFTHGGVIRMLTRHLGHDDFAPNGALIAVDWTAQRIISARP